MPVLIIWLIAFTVGVVYGVIRWVYRYTTMHHSSRQNAPQRSYERPPETPVECTPKDPETLEFLKSQRRDYMELYDYAQREYSNAETIQQKERYKKRLISLDAKLFSLDQKIAKLQKI